MALQEPSFKRRSLAAFGALRIDFGVDTSRSTAAALKVEVQTLSMWPEARAFCEAERVPQAVGIEGTAAFLGS